MKGALKYMLIQLFAGLLAHYVASAFGYPFGTEGYGQVLAFVFLMSLTLGAVAAAEWKL